MTCLEVRELLPEHAIGVLGELEHERIQRHLQTCAGCRKEAGDLGQAASTLAFALAPAPVPEGLGDRVVARVRRAAGAPGTRRRARTATVALVAAALVFASLGWGAVMAGRAERFADRAAQAQREQAVAIEHFQQVLGNVIPARGLRPTTRRTSVSSPRSPPGTGGGFALQLVSPRILDFVMVIVNGLDDPSVLPLRVQLVNDRGRVLRAGRIDDARRERRRRGLPPVPDAGARRLHHRQRGGLGRPAGPHRHGRPVDLAARGQRSSSSWVNEPVKLISTGPRRPGPGMPSKRIEMSNVPVALRLQHLGGREVDEAGLGERALPDVGDRALAQRVERRPRPSRR